MRRSGNRWDWRTDGLMSISCIEELTLGDIWKLLEQLWRKILVVLAFFHFSSLSI